MSKPSEPETGATAAEPITDCPRCLKPLPLCICDSVKPIENKVSLLILQHPQEQDRALGTARLTALHFKDAVLKIGLSWPSLSKALGRPVHDPSRWAVLYLGSAKVADLDTDRDVVAINRKGEVEDSATAFLRLASGATMSLELTWGLLMERDFAYVNLFGTGGAALLNPLRIHKGMHGTLVNVTPTLPTPGNQFKQSVEGQIAHFAESLRKGGRPMGSAEEILPVMELMDAIYRSAEQGKEVRLG